MAGRIDRVDTSMAFNGCAASLEEKTVRLSMIPDAVLTDMIAVMYKVWVFRCCFVLEARVEMMFFFCPSSREL